MIVCTEGLQKVKLGVDKLMDECGGVRFSHLIIGFHVP